MWHKLHWSKCKNRGEVGYFDRGKQRAWDENSMMGCEIVAPWWKNAHSIRSGSIWRWSCDGAFASVRLWSVCRGGFYERSIAKVVILNDHLLIEVATGSHLSFRSEGSMWDDDERDDQDTGDNTMISEETEDQDSDDVTIISGNSDGSKEDEVRATIEATI